MWVVTPSCENARTRLRVGAASTSDAASSSVAESEKDPPLEDASGIALGGLTPRQFVQFMRSARHSGLFGDRLEIYLHQLEVEGRLQPIPMISKSLQFKLYLDMSRLIVFAFHRAVMALDSASLWGHRLQVVQTPIFGDKSRARARCVGEAQLKIIVDAMVASQVVRLPMVPRMLEKRLYTNCMMVVFQLINELLAGEGEEVAFLGHKLRFFLEPEPVELVRRLLEEQPVTHCKINEAAVAELVDELLADQDTNIKWIPDVIESQIYQSVMRLMIRIAEHVVCRLRLNFLGREIHMSILSRMDIRAKQERLSRPEAKSGGALYYEEEDPLRTVSTTELEERLKDLDQQRRLLQALQELRKVNFDLTEDTPMQQRKARGSAAPAVDLTSIGDPEDIARAPTAPVHEFQTLAHTLKLARSLSVKLEVDADIEVPHGMIADLETYPVWMPWCTSGRLLGTPRPAADKDGEVALEGQVGFGFETGTFLGTVGDTVHYSVTVKQPADCPEGTDGLVTRRAGVTADAVNGFTYGKRLVYDWRFTQVEPKRTTVELDMLFQARSVLYMPVWDSLQNMIVNNMLSAFKARADQLQASRAAGSPVVAGAGQAPHGGSGAAPTAAVSAAASSASG